MDDPLKFGIRLPNETARQLYRECAQLEVIDAHEHLFPESYRIAQPPDAAFLFQPQYTAFGLISSGMPRADLDSVGYLDRPLDERWALLKPHLPNIRDLALTKALMIGLQELYGVEEVTDDNYVDLTERMRSFNRPGIYRDIFGTRCRVVAAFVQQYNSSDPPWEMPPTGSFRLPQMWENHFNPLLRIDALRRVEQYAGRSLGTLDDFTDALVPALLHVREQGVLGVKLFKQAIGEEPNRDDVAPAFDRLLAAGTDRVASPLLTGEQAALRDYIGHAMLRAAGVAGLRVLFHSGTRAAGVDFRLTDPNLHIPLFLEYPEVTFEILEEQSVSSEQIAVVGAQDHHRVLALAATFEEIEDAPELAVDLGDGAEVTGPRQALLLFVELAPDPLRPPIQSRAVGQTVIRVRRWRQVLIAVLFEE